ncbi:MAG: DUF6600 domain-containing protein [Verrucomicrobiota bacterium]|jgi:hypothetical protein
MKTPELPTSAWLVVFGTAAIIVVGAFAHFDTRTQPQSTGERATAPVAVDEQAAGIQSAGEPALPANLSPGLAEIIRLAESHVDEGVVLAFIQNSGRRYTPTADEILYLSDLGLSQNVIAALFKGTAPAGTEMADDTGEAPVNAPPTPPPAPPPPDANAPVFASALASYGAWVQVPDYGSSWQPTVEVLNPDWQPYLDHGQWLDTDSGWYWQSDYSWGWAAFHYGGWVKAPPYGWVWVPGKVWGPAWVGWRSAPSYIGWAPLPPGVSLNVLAQLTYNGHPIGAGFDFGLAPSSFVFVNMNNFLSRNLPRRVATPAHAAALASASVVVNHYTVADHKVINGGISRDEVAAATEQPARQVALRPVSTPPGAGAGLGGKTLAVYRPDAAKASSLASSESSSYLLNKPSVSPTATESPATLASAQALEPALFPGADATAGQPVQLPPLRFATPAPPIVNHYVKSSVGEAARVERPEHHQWRNWAEGGMAERSRGSTPGFEGGNRAARALEAPSRPAAQAEPVRAAAPEPARASAAPAASASKSSK